MKVHELKCHSGPFQSVYAGVKSFEIRVNDRDYQVGDSLHLKEYDPKTNSYSGRWVSKRITYMIHGGNYGLPENLVVMAIV
jgi:hypothetical protein